jgi:hypothetical protein
MNDVAASTTTTTTTTTTTFTKIFVMSYSTFQLKRYFTQHVTLIKNTTNT